MTGLPSFTDVPLGHSSHFRDGPKSEPLIGAAIRPRKQVSIQREKATQPSSLFELKKRRLFKLCRDARKSRIQLGTETVHGNDDGAGDTSGNQAVFNCSRAGLRTPEPIEKFPHGGCSPGNVLSPHVAP